MFIFKVRIWSRLLVPIGKKNITPPELPIIVKAIFARSLFSLSNLMSGWLYIFTKVRI
jgi:hypothetical protein